MKRFTTIALVVVLMLSIAVPALADDPTTINQNTVGDKKGNTTLTYEVTSTYTVTIPTAVTLAAGTNTTAQTISVADAIIDFGESLTVTITDATNYSTGFRLKDDTNENYLTYTIKDASDAPVVKDTAFLTVASGTADGSASLTYTTEAATKSGSYSDTLTFTVAVG